MQIRCFPVFLRTYTKSRNTNCVLRAYYQGFHQRRPYSTAAAAAERSADRPPRLDLAGRLEVLGADERDQYVPAMRSPIRSYSWHKEGMPERYSSIMTRPMTERLFRLA